MVTVGAMGTLRTVAHRMAPGLIDQLVANRQRSILKAKHRPTPV